MAAKVSSSSSSTFPSAAAISTASRRASRPASGPSSAKHSSRLGGALSAARISLRWLGDNNAVPRRCSNMAISSTVNSLSIRATKASNLAYANRSSRGSLCTVSGSMGLRATLCFKNSAEDFSKTTLYSSHDAICQRCASRRNSS